MSTGQGESCARSMKADPARKVAISPAMPGHSVAGVKRTAAGCFDTARRPFIVAGSWPMVAQVGQATLRSPPRRQPPLVEFVPQPCRGVPAQGHSDDEDEVGSPGVVMAFAAAPTLERLPRFPSGVEVGRHDVRQLVKARMLASTRVPSIIRADLHPSLRSVGTAAAWAAHNAYRIGVCGEGSLEPPRLLNRVDVGTAR